MLQVNWFVAVHPLSNKFAMVVKIKVTGELKLNDSPDLYHWCLLKIKKIYNHVFK